MSSSYSRDDAAKDSGSSRRDVSGAWHNARNDSSKDDRFRGRNERKESATRDRNYYTGQKWNPRTREWE